MLHSAQGKLQIAAPGIPVGLLRIHNLRECSVDTSVNTFHAPIGLGMIGGSLQALDTKVLEESLQYMTGKALASIMEHSAG
jgi:hypothetical protein